MQQVCYGYLLGNFSSHSFSQVCVFACASVCEGVSGAPSSSGCSRGSRSLCHTALETEFIVAQVLQDHLCFHRLHRHHPHSSLHVCVCVYAWIVQERRHWHMHKQACDCGCGVVLKQLATGVEDAALRLHMERVTDSGRSWWEDMWHSHFVIHRDSSAFKNMLVHVPVLSLFFSHFSILLKKSKWGHFPTISNYWVFWHGPKNRRWKHTSDIFKSNARYTQPSFPLKWQPWYAPTLTGSSLLSEHTQTHWYSYRH